MRPTLRAGRDLGFWALCFLALAVVVAPSLAMVGTLLQQAGPALSLHLLTATTADNGLQNAVLGSLLIMLGVLLVAGPIGVLGGIYLAEFAPTGRAWLLRLGYETLAGVPSIVIGFVGYVLLAQELHWGFSLLSGIMALSAIVLPYVVKTTEVALLQVPSTLRDAGMALGLSRLTTLRRALLPPAVPAIASGLVLALAIAVGETAPLLYTLGFSDQDPSLSLFQHPIGYLTYVVYLNATLPTRLEHEVAGAAGLATLLLILALIGVGRLASRRAARFRAQLPT
ncbi:MAG: PstA family ABC transporter permease [Candidatus Dormibacteria bacterium]